MVPWGKGKGWQKGKGKGDNWQTWEDHSQHRYGSHRNYSRSESTRSHSSSREDRKKKFPKSPKEKDTVGKAKETLMANDPEYKALLLAKSMAEDDENIRKQALMFADAMKGSLEKMASKMSASSGDKPLASEDTPPVSSRSHSPRHSPRESDKGISKHQAAWVEAIFGFAFDIPPATSWDQVTSTLASRLEKTSSNRKNLENSKALVKFLDRQTPRPKTPKTGRDKAELLVSIIKK